MQTVLWRCVHLLSVIVTSPTAELTLATERAKDLEAQTNQQKTDLVVRRFSGIL